MAINYYLEIESMDVIPTLSGLTYVVDRINWKYLGVDQVTNNRDYVGWSTKLSGVTENSFIEYSGLTYEIVETWLNQVLDFNELKTMVDTKIDLLNNPPTIKPPIPWA